MFVVDPDPNDATLRFYYYLSRSAAVQLEMLSINGRRFAIIDSGRQSAGDHIIYWSANNINDGIYLIKFSVGEEIAIYNISVIQQENIA